MTERSYLMTIESFGLRLSLSDPLFKRELERISQSEESLSLVEEQLSRELCSRHKSPHLLLIGFSENGSRRITLFYEEDGMPKELYFSRESGVWLIDYFAGRPVD